MVDGLTQDIRYALRALRRSPGFTAVAILSLALGIGANTAIFSLIDAVMLRALPVSHPEDLLQVTMGTQQFFTNPVWEQVRDRQDVFSGIFAYGRWAFNLAKSGETHNVTGQYVSGEYFGTIGVRAALGRTLTASDDRHGCAATAVLSYGFWQREYGGRTDLIGKTIPIDGHPFAIVGVAQPGFTGIEVGSAVDVLVPICAEKIVHGEQSLLNKNYALGWGWLQVVGRRKPGISTSQATARLGTLAPAIFGATPPQDWRVEDREAYFRNALKTEPAANGLSYLRRQYRHSLLVLMGIVGVVLLIACCNLTNLLLARSSAREREIAIRTALGSGRGRLVRQMLTESVLLAGGGAVLGVVVAKLSTRLLVGFLDIHLDLTLDGRVLAFTAGIAILTGVLVGLMPAWRGTRVQPQFAMKAQGHGVIQGSKFRLGKALVTLQVALSVLLVVGAGLMLSTFWNLASLDAGFQPDQVLLVAVDLRNGSDAPEHRRLVYHRILDELRAIPGVRSASTSNITPMCGCKGTLDVVIEGYTIRAREDVTVLFNKVGDHYFETLGTSIIAGRDFNSNDTVASPKVAVVNQNMARKFFGASNPLGRYLRIQEGNTIGDPYEIVGIVGDAKYGTLRDETAPTLYLTRNQELRPLSAVHFEVRAAAGPPEALIGSLRAAIGHVDRTASFEFTTLAARIDKFIERERLLATLSGVFGALALILAMIGLYGVMSYNVAKRRNEIGIRMALGAEQARVLRMIMGEGAVLIAAGLTLGLGVAMISTRFVASLLYGTKPNDPLTFSVAAAVSAGVGMTAAYLPARRASRLDPTVALRDE